MKTSLSTQQTVWIRTDVLFSNTKKKSISWKDKEYQQETEWEWSRANIISGDCSSIISKESNCGDDDHEIHVKVDDPFSMYNLLSVVIVPSKLKSSIESVGAVILPANPSDYTYHDNNMQNTHVDFSIDDDEDEKSIFTLEEKEGQPPHDLNMLTHLHEPSLVHNLRKRFQVDQIYTSTGPILLALNPFKECPELYDDTVMGNYWICGEHSSSPIPILKDKFNDDDSMVAPHVYGLADKAFRLMMEQINLRNNSKMNINDDINTPTDQCILVSGESGAGKTVTTKHVMTYLATISKRKAMHFAAQSNEKKKRESLLLNGDLRKRKGSRRFSRGQSWKAGANTDTKILESNPILESFGNARTTRNDNSSRFGKFIELQFKDTGTLIGASIETYLLEKVRVVHQGEGERNYHIFYEMLAGCTVEERKIYFLDGDGGVGDNGLEANDFKMTCKSEPFNHERRDGVLDDDQFELLVYAMGTVGFGVDCQQDVFSIIAALLHSSNLTFLRTDNFEDSSQFDQSNKHLLPFLTLLGLKPQTLNDAICTKTIFAGKEAHTQSLPVQKACEALEGLVKALYSSLFTYLVRGINDSIDASANAKQSSSAFEKAGYIGVLDIFGFESFTKNSFEQLCINYCNEALQQQFNRYIFKIELEEYSREGIDLVGISFQDNQDVLDLIDKKPLGIIPILDDQAKAPGASDSKFLTNLYQICAKSNRFQANHLQRGKNKFGIVHYAGVVEYDTIGFVEKNKDSLPSQASVLLLSSTKVFVNTLAGIISEGNAIPEKASHRPGRKATQATVGGQFTKQLRNLRKRVDSTTPHYIRCLKPNNDLKADIFSARMISEQLRYSGVLEALRISRVGFPQRYRHDEFVKRYTPLVPEKDIFMGHSVSDVCLLLARAAEKRSMDGGDNKIEMTDVNSSTIRVKGIEVGKSKVFLQQHAFDMLERVMAMLKENAVVQIQAFLRCIQAKAKYHTVTTSIIVLQTFVRKVLAKIFVQKIREDKNKIQIRALTVIQTGVRGYLSRNKLESLKVARDLRMQEEVTLTIVEWGQRMYRGQRGRKEFATLKQVRKRDKVDGRGNLDTTLKTEVDNKHRKEVKPQTSLDVWYNESTKNQERQQQTPKDAVGEKPISSLEDWYAKSTKDQAREESQATKESDEVISASNFEDWYFQASNIMAYRKKPAANEQITANNISSFNDWYHASVKDESRQTPQILDNANTNLSLSSLEDIKFEGGGDQAHLKAQIAQEASFTKPSSTLKGWHNNKAAAQLEFVNAKQNSSISIGSQIVGKQEEMHMALKELKMLKRMKSKKGKFTSSQSMSLKTETDHVINDKDVSRNESMTVNIKNRIPNLENTVTSSGTTLKTNNISDSSTMADHLTSMTSAFSKLKKAKRRSKK